MWFVCPLHYKSVTTCAYLLINNLSDHETYDIGYIYMKSEGIKTKKVIQEVVQVNTKDN